MATAALALDEEKGPCPYCGAPFISREPWWVRPVDNEADAQWGTLYMCANTHPVFRIDEVPTDEEIMNRPSCRVYNDQSPTENET